VSVNPTDLGACLPPSSIEVALDVDKDGDHALKCGCGIVSRQLFRVGVEPSTLAGLFAFMAPVGIEPTCPYRAPRLELGVSTISPERQMIHRGRRTRTADLLLPKQARYQASLYPERRDSTVQRT
jgi:hypothetical protein